MELGLGGIRVREIFSDIPQIWPSSQILVWSGWLLGNARAYTCRLWVTSDIAAGAQSLIDYPLSVERPFDFGNFLPLWGILPVGSTYPIPIVWPLPVDPGD